MSQELVTARDDEASTSVRQVSMAARLLRFFVATCLSFAFFFITMMPFVTDRSSRELVVPGLLGGLLAASLSSVFEWMRLRHKQRAAEREPTA